MTRTNPAREFVHQCAAAYEPIAIVGSSCRFAGNVGSPSQLWDLLCKAPDLTRDVPSNRFNAKAFYHKDGEYHGTTNSVRAYWLDQDTHSFDASFFSITPKEAEAMDPQQRLLLEVVYEAMESAGFPLGKYQGKEVGVFSGCMTQDYETLSARDELATSQYFPTGNSRAIMSNRISYAFNFQGPSMTIDTACSSSLVALHQAILSMRTGGCVMACVTGANLMLTPEQFIVESTLHMLSPTGQCRMWDTGANGYARGEGVAALLLKPLSQAIADGDIIEAVIREVGVNADGKTSGITMPNPAAQAALIRKTYQNAGLDPSNPSHRCQYFEAHGTGTQAGDPREAQAIHEAFFSGGKDDPKDKMLVGSVKTVIGHTESTAGLAGVLKTVWGIKHGFVPPNLHFKTLNPSVEPYYSHLQIPTSMVPWPEPAPGQPRRASVNSFGFGGANAHAIIEAYVPDSKSMIGYSNAKTELESETLVSPGSGAALAQESAVDLFTLPIVISAASPKSMQDIIQSYRVYLTQSDVNIHELAWNQYLRRSNHSYGVTFPAATKAEALKALDSFVQDGSALPASQLVRFKHKNNNLCILGIFTGQGAQWPTMSRSLFQQNAVYRDTIRKLDAHLKSCPSPCEWSLEEELLANEDASRVQEAAVSQPLCTAVQIALVDLMRSIGITFHTVVGHSSGEIAAAYAAGRLSAEDAIVVSYYRGMVAHLASGPEGQKGGMLAAGLSLNEAGDFCSSPGFDGHIRIAANNAPTTVTLSGNLDIIRLAQEELEKQGKFARVLKVDTAYHSHHMDKPAVEYIKAMQEYGVKPLPGDKDVTWISSVEGRSRIGAQDLDCQYWADNMVHQVQFNDAVSYALAQGSEQFDCAIEIGPHPALQNPVLQTTKALGGNLLYTCPLVRGKDSGVTVADFIGFVWSNFGADKVDFGSYIENSPMPGLVRSRLYDLPRYPFDHSADHWRESRISRHYHFKPAGPHELLGVRGREDNQYEMKWRNFLKPEKIPWLEHHSFQGQALLPASAYCIMALEASRQYLDGRPASMVEIRDIQIYSGIAIDRNSDGVEIMFSLSILPSAKGSSTIDATFNMYSAPADRMGQMKNDASGSLQIVLGEPSMSVLPPRSVSMCETMPAEPNAFYEMMDGTGLKYTGPFKALTAIERRYRYCSTTLARRHPDDTTTMDFSPATLDSCFQSAFLSYAYPGDGSLWTSFLPTSIERVRFNLAVLDSTTMADPKATLTVDTHIIRRALPAQAEKAAMTVDINIYNENGEAEVQVEGLTVRALANTQPKEDQELYLHTVFDTDPTDAIVKVIDPEMVSDELLLAESCRRISSFYGPQEKTTKGPSNDTPDSADNIESMIRNSHHADYLETIRRVGADDPTRLFNSLPSIMQEARQVSRFRNHVGRVLRQITHRYPWMNILYLTPEARVEFLSPMVAAIGSSFQSFTIGMSQSHSSLASQGPIATSIERISTQDIDLTDTLEGQIRDVASLDLVFVPVTMLGEDNTNSILKNIGQVMNDGGFLVLVDLFRTILGEQSNTKASGASMLPHLSDTLKANGFVQQAEDSDQSFEAGFVLVRQFRSPKSSQPSVEADESSIKTDTLLLIKGPSGEGDDGLVTDLKCQLSPNYGSMVTCTLDDATSSALSECTAAIVLAELEEALTPKMTQHRINQLRALFRPNLTILWVTCDARTGNPDHAATFGFLRTIMAEFPTMKMQVLDLESVSTYEASKVISKAFTQLTLANKDVNANTLWTVEQEIHMEKGHRVIPRVMPWTDANERVNALHRVVTKPVNTLRQCVELIPHISSNDSVRFEVKGTTHNTSDVTHGNISIKVDYSSALAFKLSGNVSAYVCVGREWVTGQRMLALSSTNSSYITCPASQAFSLKSNGPSNLMVIYTLVRCLAALTSVSSVDSHHERIVIVDPDVDFARCLVNIVDPSASAKDRIAIFGTSCNKADTLRYTDTYDGDLSVYAPLCMHPQISTMKLKQIFSRDSNVFSFLPGDNDLSNRIADTISRGRSKYYSGFSMYNSDAIMRKEDFGHIQYIWKVVTMLTLQHASEIAGRSENLSTVSLNEIQSQSGTVRPFQIVNWKGERDTLEPVHHIIDEQLVFPNKTYFMFGMTRDSGQSICRLLLEQGAKHIVLASRNANATSHWVTELCELFAADIRIERADVTSRDSLMNLKTMMADSMPPPGGVINGAMVLDDRVFDQMTEETWSRVMGPKTIGSANLDMVFNEPDLDFFIMTSSFAAIGGHPGQSNYAAANMYMNGLAANRRQRGLAGTALNIGVIYGVGFLQREKDHLYAGLEREGYPPISEHNLHHMFLEAIAAGRPQGGSSQPFDITTGLRRYQRGSPHPLHWHKDPRFGHFSDNNLEDVSNAAAEAQKSLQEDISGLTEQEDVANAIGNALEQRLEMLLGLPVGSIDRNGSLAALGVDSLTAVEVRNWLNDSLNKDVSVIKILDAQSIHKLCMDLADQVLSDRVEPAAAAEPSTQ